MDEIIEKYNLRMFKSTLIKLEQLREHRQTRIMEGRTWNLRSLMSEALARGVDLIYDKEIGNQ